MASPRPAGGGDGRQQGDSPLSGVLLNLAERHGFYSGIYIHFGHAPAGHGNRARLSASSIMADRRFGEPLSRSGVARRAAAAHKPFAWAGAEEPGLLDAAEAGIAIPVQDHTVGPALIALIGVDLDRAREVADGSAAALLYAAADIHVEALASVALAPARATLTAREIECLRLAALGWTVVETSAAIRITPRTVEFHLKNAADKLGAANKAHAVALAVSGGLFRI